MDSFKFLRRRTTELFQSLPQALPSLGGAGSNAMKGTWEKIQVPPLPRSSHSADIVAGNLYIFGGEIKPREPVDNDMHVITLPSSGAPADYYAIKAKPANPSAPPAGTPAIPTIGEGEPTPDAAAAGTGGAGRDERHLADVSLTSPSPGPGKDKDKGPSPDLPDVPAPRVGHATAVIGHRIFLFGGRGGPDMAALDEGGRVWVFDTRTHLWSFLDPAPPAAGADVVVPPPRSYHAAVATAKPDTFGSKGPRTRADSWRDWALGGPGADELGTPQRPVVGVLAERATDADADGYGTLIVHGGCLSGEGQRAADVWAFDVRSRVWQRLPDAPGPARGGAALALSRGRLYRFGGFDGLRQQGGQLDFLELGVDSFDDRFSASAGGGAGKEEVVLCARGGWRSLVRGKVDVGYKEVDEADRPLHTSSSGGGDGDDDAWPGDRSVAALEAVTVGGGREYLVLMLGEREASGAGHAAAGKFWDDVWAFQVPSQGMSPASVADTVFSVVGRKSGEGKWTRVQMGPHDDEDDASADGPGPRGWVASATMGDLEENGIVVWGGLGEGNQRLGDGWILRLG